MHVYGKLMLHAARSVPYAPFIDEALQAFLQREGVRLQPAATAAQNGNAAALLSPTPQLMTDPQQDRLRQQLQRLCDDDRPLVMQLPGSAALYALWHGKRHGFDSAATFNALHFDWDNVHLVPPVVFQFFREQSPLNAMWKPRFDFLHDTLLRSAAVRATPLPHSGQPPAGAVQCGIYTADGRHCCHPV